jgi:hypothetical protein
LSRAGVNELALGAVDGVDHGHHLAEGHLVLGVKHRQILVMVARILVAAVLRPLTLDELGQIVVFGVETGDGFGSWYAGLAT